ncbi:MAG: hypothetical protein AAB795_03960, partial [Patescibacteria group bacterium]
FIFLAIVVGIWIIGLVYFLPFKYWWFDIAVHFLGGLWAFSLAVTIQNHYKINIVGTNNYIASFFIFVGLVVLIGIFWEFAEFIADRYIFKTGFTHMRGVYEDTLADLFMDIIGGALGFFIYLLNNKKTNV